MNRTISNGAAISSADKYYVYRPLIDLIGITEGTAPPKGGGYNETLNYGAYTGGDVKLVSMTLDQVDSLQTRMLAHPRNKLKSSAVGWGQIIRTTMRDIRDKLKLDGSALYDAEMQDRMICYLLGVRGIDKWLAGRLSESTLLDNLSAEWASLPKAEGGGTYAGQHAAVKPDRVRGVLAEVRRRHLEGQPETEVVERPVVPVTVEKEVRQKTNWFTSIFSGTGFLGAVGAWAAGVDTIKLLIIVGVVIAAGIGFLLLGEWIVRRLKIIQKAIAA